MIAKKDKEEISEVINFKSILENKKCFCLSQTYPVGTNQRTAFHPNLNPRLFL